MRIHEFACEEPNKTVRFVQSEAIHGNQLLRVRNRPSIFHRTIIPINLWQLRAGSARSSVCAFAFN